MVRYRSNLAVILGLSLGMMSGMARAQQATVLSASIPAEPLISAPEPVAAATPQPLLSSSRSGIQVVPPAAGEQRVADRQFWTMVAFTAGSAVLDGETTIRGLQTPGRQEMNPLLGSHPDRVRFYATVGATDTAMAYLAYRLKRGGHEKLWRLPLLGAGSVHLGGAINNLRY
ncbi:MAG TPA: hypothetical protein VMT05_03140 [Terriglobales bacterium]|jgi:hypothetical protein|nr:hypothetical protein [Terriglobales bacterium]